MRRGPSQGPLLDDAGVLRYERWSGSRRSRLRSGRVQQRFCYLSLLVIDAAGMIMVLDSSRRKPHRVARRVETAAFYRSPGGNPAPSVADLAVGGAVARRWLLRGLEEGDGAPARLRARARERAENASTGARQLPGGGPASRGARARLPSTRNTEPRPCAVGPKPTQPELRQFAQQRPLAPPSYPVHGMHPESRRHACPARMAHRRCGSLAHPNMLLAPSMCADWGHSVMWLIARNFESTTCQHADLSRDLGTLYPIRLNRPS
jgi:hypothetical protein